MVVFLIGFRGSGKSTVAAELSRRLGWPWVDADEELERRAGKSIRQIFAEDGEPVFRDLESAVVADLASRQRHVVALGGGAVMRQQNRAALAGRGMVVWLRALPETLAERIAADPTTRERRPSLTGRGEVAEIRDLLAARTPVYQACADVTIDVEGRSPADIAEQIAQHLAASPNQDPNNQETV